MVAEAPHPSPMHAGIYIKGEFLRDKDGAGVFPVSGNI